MSHSSYAASIVLSDDSDFPQPSPSPSVSVLSLSDENPLRSDTEPDDSESHFCEGLPVEQQQGGPVTP